MRDRAVSDLVGFVLVFSLITMTVGVVYVAGFTGLEDARDAERVNNMERAFEVLDDNINDVTRNGAPSRATEMKLAEAQLSTSDRRDVSISADGVDPVVARPVTIRYNPGSDTSIVYENGAVIRVDNGNAVMLEEPDFLFDDGNVVVRYIEPQGSGQSIGGTSTTVLVRAERTSSKVLVNRGGSTNVTIAMRTHPDRVDAWENYYTESIEAATGTTPTCNRSTVNSQTVKLTCFDFNTDKLAVSKVQIEVELT